MEVFKGYFWNQKKNKARSKGGSIAMLIGFALLMIVMMGGMFTGLSLMICGDMVNAGMGWMYFLTMGMLALLLGVFGSVFNTFSGLYKAKDNDLLLSMPIPVKDIMIARLLNVYLMGLMYSAVVIVPAVIVYWIIGQATVGSIIGGLGLMLVISLIALVLSCLLGYVVAQISSRLKYKSFVTVIIALVGFGAYYFVCFRLQTMIQTLVTNIVIYGEEIKGKAYLIYCVGRIGEGNLVSLAIALVISLALVGLCGWMISRTFLKLATVSDVTVRHEYKEQLAKERGIFRTLLAKEFGRFTASANYMLNCGLGIVLMLVSAVAFLIKGNDLMDMFSSVFGIEVTLGILCLMIGVMASMNDMAAPSVSLEGKSLWILQSLPIDPKKILLAKLSVQLILSVIPLILVILSVLFVLDLTPVQMLLMVLFPILYTVMIGLFDLMLGIVFANLTWTNELVPVKQGAAIFIALFGGWILTAGLGVLYVWKGRLLGFEGYFGICTVVEVIVSAVLFGWMMTKGVKRFVALK